MTPRLPQQDSATGRALKTAAQAVLGFVFGLIVVVWHVPGVSQAVVTYTQSHLLDTLVMIGLPIALSSGIVSFVWNLFRTNMPAY